MGSSWLSAGGAPMAISGMGLADGGLMTAIIVSRGIGPAAGCWPRQFIIVSGDAQARPTAGSPSAKTAATTKAMFAWSAC